MMKNTEELVRQNILDLKPYSSARSLYSSNDALLLDANESGEDPFGGGLNRYPDPLQKELKKSISKIKSVPLENVFLGNGSDEAIDLLFRIFCEPGKDEIIVCPPTYGMYRVQANIHGVPIKEVFLDGEFNLRPQAILKEATSRSKLLFICSPNNPTGNAMDSEHIETLLKNFPGIVVIDEAYIDFSGQESWINRLSEFSNLVVLQTFSKAWALAGARLGMAFASEEIIHYLNAVKFPYNVNKLTQEKVLEALGRRGVFGNIERVLKERKRLEERLLKVPKILRAYPSNANFLLVKFEDCNGVFQYLSRRKIIVRDRSKEPGCEGCLRLTIGTKRENEKLLNALLEFSENKKTVNLSTEINHNQSK